MRTSHRRTINRDVPDRSAVEAVFRVGARATLSLWSPETGGLWPLWRARAAGLRHAHGLMVSAVALGCMHFRHPAACGPSSPIAARPVAYTTQTRILPTHWGLATRCNR